MGCKEQKPLTICHAQIRDCCDNMEYENESQLDLMRTEAKWENVGAAFSSPPSLPLPLPLFLLLTLPFFISAYLLYLLLYEQACSLILFLHYSSLHGTFASDGADFRSDSV